ncbi:TIR domain-containing protein [Pseudoroseicyclus sp. CXY001]|uniref:TIR domain-containing protein n=1 Tax=Pseudoroseicyclus sp. CXY001 TaxID=3242492 RepID=UPI003570B8D0
MGLVTIGQALLAADRELASTYRDAKLILREEANTGRTSFDIFLSHSKIDEKYVLGAKRILEEKGFTIYVDWINDQQLDRSNVNKNTADYLRTRMKQCKLLFYLHTENASVSKWCPWELGFFNGHSGSAERTFIFPLVFTGEKFTGQEYLELYPIVDIDNVGKESSFRKDVWGYFPSTEREWRQISSILDRI